MSDILLIRTSALITDADVAAFVPIANRHYAQDFTPEWGVPITLYFGDGPADAWKFSLQDGINQPGDLAYHYDDSAGRPDAFIDVKGALTSGNDWRTPTDHEIKEAAVDPSCTLFGADNSTLREPCDPVEEQLIMFEGVPFSNFVFRAYFGLASGTKYDFNGELTAPAPATAPGGYVERFIGGQYNITYGMKARLNPGFMASRLNGRRLFRASRAP